MAVTVDVDSIGALLRSRTVDIYGNELGTFNADTRPTHDEVVSIGTGIMNEVVGTFSNCPNAPEADVQRIVNLRIAAQIELTYYPEQSKIAQGTRGTSLSTYGALAEEAATIYRTTRRTWCPLSGDADKGGDGGVLISKPKLRSDWATVRPIIGYATRW